MNLIYEPRVMHAWSSVQEIDTCYDSELFSYCQPWNTDDRSTSLEDIPEIAGRICYQSFRSPRPGGNKAYLGHILEAGHGSVLEHSTVGFVITGVSRSLTHELIRHRAGVAVSELSQRYFDASKMGVVVPPRYIGREGSLEWVKWLYSVTAAFAAYEEIAGMESVTGTLERKRVREAARSVLPNCTETHIAVTANLRAWRNIIEQRGCIHADLEIRRLAVAIFGKLQELAPNAFQDGEKFVDEDDRESIRFRYRKV